MGGLLVLGAWAVAVVALWPSVAWSRSFGFVLAAAALHGTIGCLDDWRSVRRHRSLGLTVPCKLIFGTVAAIVLFFLFRDVVSIPQRIPFSTHSVVLPPVASFALVWISLLATSNSLNLADGLDGLAAGLTVLIAGGLLFLSPSDSTFAVLLPLVGALLGFLWVNAHPAAIILGDVGAFGLGGIVASVSLCTGTVFFLPMVAGVLVLEAGSVLLQVGSCRLTGVRLFKMTPLHHHFEASVHARSTPVFRGFEWPEAKVVARFWIAGALFAGLTVWASRVG